MSRPWTRHKSQKKGHLSSYKQAKDYYSDFSKSYNSYHYPTKTVETPKAVFLPNPTTGDLDLTTEEIEYLKNLNILNKYKYHLYPFNNIDQVPVSAEPSLEAIFKVIEKLDIPSLSQGLINKLTLRTQSSTEEDVYSLTLFAECNGKTEKFYVVTPLDQSNIESLDRKELLVLIFQKLYELIEHAKADKEKF